VSGHAKMPPASHQVSATSLKLLIQQIHPRVRVERDSGVCVACVVAKQEIQEVESAKRAGAPYAHHRYQARDTNTKL
jgi:hypothetical protein